MIDFKPVTVVEVHPFPDRAATIWSDEEREKFINYIAYHPLEGVEITGTGGMRKIRWKRQGMGKRGGARIIYFYYDESTPIFLISIYAKSKKENLTSDEKKKMCDWVSAFKENIKQNKGE